ncbi:hypothetical protein chiPu_0008568 [Chiloscyllium punctatum]|uniref:Uncharacterized protein n=1 Tax=Chiloscyllium punctatum TaxID=137246 RepID=A0A401SI96_CHIPU|nr:hypothetical protein [Chiloscyllium punctatum]
MNHPMRERQAAVQASCFIPSPAPVDESATDYANARERVMGPERADVCRSQRNGISSKSFSLHELPQIAGGVPDTQLHLR